MPLLGKNCGITVNGTGLAANTVSLSQQSTISQITPIGFNISHYNYVNGANTNNLQISYLSNTNQDPLYWNFSGIKNNYSGTPVSINLGGLTGLFYLTNYSFDAQPNQPVIINAELINFTNITGNFTGLKINNITGNFNQRMANGTSISFLSANAQVPAFGLRYSCEIEYIPFYKLGQKEPYFICYNRATENINFSSDEYTGIGFYGRDVNEIFKNSSILRLTNASTISGTWVMDFILTGSKISSIEQNFETQNVVKNNYSINNIY